MDSRRRVVWDSTEMDHCSSVDRSIQVFGLTAVASGHESVAENHGWDTGDSAGNSAGNWAGNLAGNLGMVVDVVVEKRTGNEGHPCRGRHKDLFH